MLSSTFLIDLLFPPELFIEHNEMSQPIQLSSNELTLLEKAFSTFPKHKIDVRDKQLQNKSSFQIKEPFQSNPAKRFLFYASFHFLVSKMNQKFIFIRYVSSAVIQSPSFGKSQLTFKQ